MVYQDLALAGNLSVTANIFLGREPCRPTLGRHLPLLDERQMDEAACNLLQKLRIDIGSVRLRVESLSGGQRQSVASGRATAFNASVAGEAGGSPGRLFGGSPDRGRGRVNWRE
jgi:ABC-type sugar transport system ATPase subunit